MLELLAAQGHEAGSGEIKEEATAVMTVSSKHFTSRAP